MILNILNPRRKIPVPMPVVTPRLVLRPVRAGDGWALHHTKTETWDQLHRWMDWAKSPRPDRPEKDERMARAGFRRFLNRDDIWLAGIEKDTGRVVLWTGLHRMNWKTRVFEVGYWVTASAQGQGYATEVTNALTRYAFDALSATKVTISHAAENAVSRRIIEKLGFAFDRIEKDGSTLGDGTKMDQVWYHRTSTEGLPPVDVQWGPP